MQNYSQVFADTLAEFVSPIVPADQGDNGKGQVCVRALYKINTTMDPDVGCITKSAGQTQFNGVAVDAGLDRSDGTGADYLTDVDLGNGTREIRLAYTPYAPPPPGTPLPPTNWKQPTADMLDWPGPLTLKADSGGGTPEPEPLPPPTDYSEVLEALDELGASLATMQVQQANDTAAIIATDTANTEKSMQQIRDLVEDVEESLIKFAMLILLRRRPDDLTAAAADVETFRDDIRERRQTRRKAQAVRS